MSEIEGRDWGHSSNYFLVETQGRGGGGKHASRLHYKTSFNIRKKNYYETIAEVIYTFANSLFTNNCKTIFIATIVNMQGSHFGIFLTVIKFCSV